MMIVSSVIVDVLIGDIFIFCVIVDNGSFLFNL